MWPGSNCAAPIIIFAIQENKKQLVSPHKGRHCKVSIWFRVQAISWLLFCWPFPSNCSKPSLVCLIICFNCTWLGTVPLAQLSSTIIIPTSSPQIKFLWKKIMFYQNSDQLTKSCSEEWTCAMMFEDHMGLTYKYRIKTNQLNGTKWQTITLNTP